MFAGIVVGLGTVAGLAPRGDGARLKVSADFASDATAGESVAIDGCCLTRLPGAGPLLAFDLSSETLARTTLGGLAAGVRVNVERSLRLGERVGGHLVLGHVDRVERVASASDEEGGGRRLRFTLAAEAAPFVSPKGSIAVAGVSLTVADLGRDWFDVAAIPFTLAATTLGALVPGARVNLELDAVTKAVLRAAALADPSRVPREAHRLLGIPDGS